jgi:low affinity Fe/Cu permease
LFKSNNQLFLISGLINLRYADMSTSWAWTLNTSFAAVSVVLCFLVPLYNYCLMAKLLPDSVAMRKYLDELFGEEKYIERDMVLDEFNEEVEEILEEHGAQVEDYSFGRLSNT